MAAVTQPFILGQFFVYINPGLSTIRQGDIIDSFRSIREDIERTAYAAYIAELTDKLFDDKTPAPYLFDQFVHTMRRLGTDDELQVPVLMYEMKAFKKGGFQPNVSYCVHCRNTEGTFSFSIAEGGLLCSNCMMRDETALPLTPVQVKLLQIFQTVRIEQVRNISVKPDNKVFFRQLFDAYYDRYGGYYLKSRKFLNQLDKFKDFD